MENTKKHNINFSIFLLATFCTMTNFSSSVIVLPVYVIELGGNEFLSGLQSTLYFLAAVLFRIYLGPLADRQGRKLPLLIGVFAFATAPLLFLYSYDFFTLTAARIYQAIGLAAFFSAGSSFTADIAPKDKIGMYIGFYRTVNALSLLVGPATAYYMIDRWGYDSWFLASFVIGAIGLLLISFVHVAPIVANSVNNSFMLMKTVIKNRRVWSIYLAISISSASYGSLVTFAAIYITQVADLANPGIYFTYFAIASIVANLTFGKLSDRFGRSIVVWPCLLSFGLALFALYLYPLHPVYLFMSSILAGIGFSGSLLVSVAWLIDTVADDLRATALAMQESTIDLSIAIGAFIFGWIGTWLGLASSFIAFAILLLVVPFIMLVKQRMILFQSGTN